MDESLSEHKTHDSCELSGARGSRFRATVLLTILYSVVGGTVLGFVITHVPSLELRLGLSALLGMLLGVVLSGTGKSMHCRSPRAMQILAVIGALLCIQSAYSTYVWNVFGATASGSPLGIFDVLLKPHVVWEILNSVAQSGMMLSNGRPMGASQVWFLWLVQAGAMAIPLYVVVVRACGKLSYCEPCKEWLSKDRKYIFLETPIDKSVEDALTRGELGALLTLKVLKEPEFPYIRLEYAVCTSCNARGIYQIFMMRNDTGSVHEWILTPTLSMRSSEKPALAKLIVTQQDLLNADVVIG